MTMWVLFVWIGLTHPLVYGYDNQAACKRDALMYRDATCMQVKVPDRKVTQ